MKAKFHSSFFPFLASHLNPVGVTSVSYLTSMCPCPYNKMEAITAPTLKGYSEE